LDEAGFSHQYFGFSIKLSGMRCTSARAARPFGALRTIEFMVVLLDEIEGEIIDDNNGQLYKVELR
jgi:hypothetical protein